MDQSTWGSKNAHDAPWALWCSVGMWKWLNGLWQEEKR
jgi:hypothetical protein